MNKDLKKEVLLTYFPEECMMIGDDHLELFISRPVELKRSEYGSNADLYDVFQVVAAVVSFVESSLNVYQMLRKKGNDTPGVQQIKEELIETTTFKLIDENQQTQILEHVVRRIEYK